MQQLGGKRIGSTPIELAYVKSELPLQLRVALDGFEPKDLNLSEAGERELSAQLVKKKKAGTRPVGNKPTGIKTNR